MSDAVDCRLELAKALRELADGSSEVALRNALSRSYYSIFHAANVLLGKVGHKNLARELENVEAGLGNRVDTLQELRQLADYTPELVALKYGGSFETFKQDAREKVNEGLWVFDRIVREIEERSRKGN